jgi:hypothetical protein
MRFVGLPALVLGTVLAVAIGSSHGGGLGTAYASSGSLRFNPTVADAPWNADSFSYDIRAENVVTTTQCLTDPEDPQSPTVPCGMGSFSITLTWDPAEFSFVNFNVGPFLGSTGRTINCPVETSGPGTATFSCVSFGATPAGPQGSGVLASVQLEPLATGPGPTWSVGFDSVAVADIQGNQFPATTTDGAVNLDPCYADIATPNNTINFSDVLVLLSHFGEEPPSAPNLDPTMDNKVTFNDALYLLRLFGVTCTP